VLQRIKVPPVCRVLCLMPGGQALAKLAASRVDPGPNGALIPAEGGSDLRALHLFKVVKRERKPVLLRQAGDGSAQLRGFGHLKGFVVRTIDGYIMVCVVRSIMEVFNPT